MEDVVTLNSILSHALCDLMSHEVNALPMVIIRFNINVEDIMFIFLLVSHVV